MTKQQRKKWYLICGIVFLLCGVIMFIVYKMDRADSEKKLEIDSNIYQTNTASIRSDMESKTEKISLLYNN